MKHASPPEPSDPGSTRRRVSRRAVGILLGVLLVAGAAAMAWGLAELIGGAGAAPLAAALAVGVVSLPLAALMLRLSREIEHRRRQLAILGGAEAPAGAANRSYFLALAERDWARARRYGGDPVLLIVDVDRFARLGETRGAEAGEIVLHEVARDIGRTLRSADALAHFGGSQIAVWLTQADPIGALDVADRIRERSEALDFGAQWRTLKITVSVGVAALRPAHQNLTALIADAEAAVQAARQAGGNCVRAAPVDPARGRRIGPSVGYNQAAGPV